VAESLHKLADLSEAAEFEGFKNPSPPMSDKAASHEPFLCHRLCSRLPIWQAVCTSAFVLGIITVGYALPWIDGPPDKPAFFQNHASSTEHSDFVDQAVSSLVATGTVLAVTSRPFLVSPLGMVPKPPDKYRLILDLRFLNSFLQITKFCYESIREVANPCQQDDLLFTIDLKSGYHHVDIHRDFWQYLGFQWRGQYYVSTQLPFGLAPACYVFTTVLRQLVKSWRARGIRLIPYIDDFLFACRGSSEFIRVQASVLAELAAAGFVVSREECQLTQSHVVKFLGFDLVDTLFGKFRLTSLQKQKLRSAIEICLCSLAKVPAKTLARVTSLAQSLSLVTGPISGLFCRFLHRALASRSSWYSSVALDAPAIGELCFWLDHLDSFQSRNIWRRFSVLRVLYYDAGGNGWGGHLHIGPEVHEAHGSWEPLELCFLHVARAVRPSPSSPFFLPTSAPGLHGLGTEQCSEHVLYSSEGRFGA
jgi:hypothetical protein